MSVKTWSHLAISCCTLALMGGCVQPTESEEPYVSISASPSKIDAKGQVTTLKIEAWTGKQPGTGSVVLGATAGSFPDGRVITLDATGSAEASFSCAAKVDAKCQGSISVQVEWTLDGVQYEDTAKVTVGDTFDAGPIVTDAGSSSDGGVGTTRVVTLTLDKTKLVADTSDKINLYATVQARGTLEPIAQTSVTFRTTLGSFSTNQGNETTQVVTTDASGVASAILYAADVFPGKATLTAVSDDVEATATVDFLDVANISYVQTNTTKSQLGIQASGRDTSTPINFQVTDSSGKGVGGVEVSFAHTGPAGISSIPSSTTDANGNVFTVLQSGNDVGVARIQAKVLMMPDIQATHPGTPIVGGKPSDQGFLVKCDRKNLGAMHDVVPPRVLTTNCRARLVDRFGNPVGLATSVIWLPEAGSIDSPVQSKPQPSASSSAETGEAVTIFRSTSLPRDVLPLSGEPSDGTDNPRDMLVSLIAVVAGEEEFYDGSGASQGVKNGKWDPGEWFVDLPEPFVDSNDNNRYDTGEPFIDTERVDCANPTAPLSKNNKWDGPNGCWDGDTQIWRTAHIVYSGPLVRTLNLSPAPSYVLPVGTNKTIAFTWGDKWFGRLSPDSPGFALTRVVGTKGSATVNAPDLAADDFGLTLTYRRLEAAESGIGTGVFTVLGACDEYKPAPASSLIRCIRNYSVSNFTQGNSGTLLFTNDSTGTSPPESVIFQFQATHGLSTPASQLISTVMQ